MNTGKFDTDRRKTENALLRQLVDAFKRYLVARDAIWSLSFLDRLLRTPSFKKTYDNYYESFAQVNALIRLMAVKTTPLELPSEAILSPEEINALMYMAYDDREDDNGNGKQKKTSKKKKKGTFSRNETETEFSPVEAAASSIVPGSSAVASLFESDFSEESPKEND